MFRLTTLSFSIFFVKLKSNFEKKALFLICFLSSINLALDRHRLIFKLKYILTKWKLSVFAEIENKLFKAALWSFNIFQPWPQSASNQKLNEYNYKRDQFERSWQNGLEEILVDKSITLVFPNFVRFFLYHSIFIA